MNAQELFLANGKATGIYFCEKCRIVHRAKTGADECCDTPKCKTCGGITENRYLDCHACTTKRFEREERERFEKAEKIDPANYTGWVCAEGEIGCNHGYFESFDELLQEIPEDELPEYVWCCHEHQFARADFSDAIEGSYSAAPEDWDSGELEGCEELKFAIEKFNQANAHMKSYSPDYSRAIVIKKPVEFLPA